jgi:hypothetical protein
MSPNGEKTSNKPAAFNLNPFRYLLQIFQLPSDQGELPLSEVDFFYLIISRSVVVAWLWIDLWLFILESLNSGKFELRHLLLPALLFVGIMIAIQIYFRREEKPNIAHLFAIQSIFLLSVPLFLPSLFGAGTFPYGFVILVLGLLAAASLTFWESIFSIAGLSILYAITFFHHFSAISYGNTLIFHGTFAYFWNIGLPLAMIYVRRRLLYQVLDIDQESETFAQSEHERMALLKVANQNDPINIAIHGTILNTLLLMKKSKEFGIPRAAFIEQLEKDFLELDRARAGKSGSLELEIKAALDNSKITPDRYVLSVFEYNISHNIYRSFIVEIIREKLLNQVRHSDAIKFRIEVVLEKNGKILIEIASQFPNQKSINLDVEVKEMMTSKTLARLLKSIGGKQSGQIQGKTLIHNFVIDPAKFDREHHERIKSARARGLEKLGGFLMVATAIYGILIIPGLYQIGIARIPIILLAVISITNIMAVALNRWVSTMAVVNSFLGAFTLYICRVDTKMCVHFEIRHWLYCALIGSLGGAALTIRNRYFRWIPLAVLVITSLAGDANTPAICKMNNLNEFPGVVLIALAVILYSILRFNNLKRFKLLLATIVNNSQYEIQVGDALNSRREEVIGKTFAFYQFLKDESNDWDRVLHRAALEHSRIRAFMLTSQNFDIPFHIEIFDLLMKRIDNGQISVLDIVGEPPSALRNYFSYRKVFHFYQPLFELREIYLTITYDNLPKLLIEVPIDLYEDLRNFPTPEAEVFSVSIAPIVENRFD